MVEATQQFRGLYHVLGGVISPMDGIGPGDLEIESLVQKMCIRDSFNIVNEWLMTLVSKSEQWIHEDEWRIVLPKEAMPLGGRSKKGGCLVMPFPKAIYLGCRIPEKLEKAVREAICLEDIKVYKAKIDRTEYKLIFE